MKAAAQTVDRKHDEDGQRTDEGMALGKRIGRRPALELRQGRNETTYGVTTRDREMRAQFVTAYFLAVTTCNRIPHESHLSGE